MTLLEHIPDESVAPLSELVQASSGLRFVGGRRHELSNKAARAFVESGIATWHDYEAQLFSPTGRALLEQLIETLTIGETYFYRHRAYFEMLERDILPEIVARRRHLRQLRLWCAGCATGEEAYSLAIAVRRVLPDVDDWQVTITATDLNRRFLARAEAGVYSDWSFRETDAAFKNEYFVPDGNRYRVRPELRRLVRFTQLNLAEERYPSIVGGIAALDLILCRNVLLYFGAELTQLVVDRMRAALVPGGWLMLGPSDPRPGLMAQFEMHTAEGALVYRRTDRDSARLSQAPEPTLAQQPEPKAIDWLAPDPTPIPLQPSDDLPDWRSAWATARASADSGELEKAEKHCEQAIARARQQPEPYYLLGTIRQAQGDDEASMAAFRKALFVDPSFVPALLAQAALYRRAGASGRARQALIRAQRLLEGRPVDEWVLAEDGLSVGRLLDAVVQALAGGRLEAR